MRPLVIPPVTPPVLPVDVISVARALLASPPERRAVRAQRIFDGAARARVYAALEGRLHPRWGDGSLDAAARRYRLAAEPFWDDPDYLSCLEMVLRLVRQNAEKKPRMQRASGAF